jgi:hypothetical protein
MIAESPLLFTPSGKGFKAHYALSFASDLMHLIHLLGDVQGNVVEAKTLMVDNTANSSACSLNLRGRSVLVAPYTLQYVDCSGAPDVVVTGGSASAQIALDILTYTVAEQAIIKKSLNVGGLPPVSVSQLNGTFSNTPLKVLSIGSPVTSFVDLTNSSSNSYPMNWGFDSSCSTGQIAIGATYHISMSCDSQELWICNTQAGSAHYSLIGG